MDTFEPLAVKEIELNKNGKLVYKVELSLLRALPVHRNIPRLLGHMHTSEKGYLILPYLPFPDVKTYIEEKGPMEEDDALFVLAQMVCFRCKLTLQLMTKIDTVNFMKTEGVAHRDVKSENIIINPDNLLIKFIDFGLGMTVNDEFTSDSEFIGTSISVTPQASPNLRNPDQYGTRSFETRWPILCGSC